LSQKPRDMHSSSYAGVNSQSDRLLGHGNLWQKKKCILYWDSLWLWASSRNQNWGPIYHQKIDFHTGFWDIMTRKRLGIICKFLHFTENERIRNFEGPQNLFKSFPVISYLNNKFSGTVSPRPRYFNWRVTDALESPSLLQTVHTSQGIQIWDKNVWTVWRNYRLFMVVPCIYRQGHKAWQIWRKDIPGFRDLLHFNEVQDFVASYGVYVQWILGL
jgi:hypothetical protein